jgi:acetyl-CoA C-acetyltransferase
MDASSLGQRDVVICSPLRTPVGRYGGALTAENVRRRYGIQRQEQDALALMSHQRAVAAQERGAFADETVAVTVKQRGATIEVSRDEHPRPDTSLDHWREWNPA